METPIVLKVRLYGAFRKYGNGVEIPVELPRPATLSEVREALAGKLKALHPDFAEEGLLGESAFADENDVLREGAVIGESRSLAVLPPVSGG